MIVTHDLGAQIDAAANRQRQSKNRGRADFKAVMIGRYPQRRNNVDTNSKRPTAIVWKVTVTVLDGLDDVTIADATVEWPLLRSTADYGADKAGHPGGC